jgi:hypothetical protein
VHHRRIDVEVPRLGRRLPHSRLDDHHNGFTVWYEAGGEVVGVLSFNADDDYRTAGELVRTHAPMAL